MRNLCKIFPKPNSGDVLGCKIKFYYICPWLYSSLRDYLFGLEKTKAAVRLTNTV